MTKGNSAIMNQTMKLFKHTRSGSYATRDRYLKSCKTFVNFLDENFKMKNLRNLQDKHLVAFAEYRQAEGISDKTLKNDLGAIRYLHDMVPNAKYELASNQQLKQEYDVYLNKTIAITGDRGWTNSEYKEMQQLLSTQSANSRVAAITSDVMTISRTMGLRVSEAVCMRRSQAEKALRTGHYEVLGEAKNGMHRSVPLSPEVHQLLIDRLPNIERGGRLFIAEGEKAHQVVNRIEKHLERYRGAIETLEGATKRIDISNEVNPLTFHGLRYSYVQDRMTDLQAGGLSWKAAAKIVTQEVGHGRIEVIKVYTNGK